MSSGEQLTTYSELAAVISNLGMLTREARRARGLSLRAAAQQIGCSMSTVLRFEQGEDVNLSNAVAILRWLDWNADAEPAS
jgi:ribosome-binding protein aMBF1 (putative translation factor)